MIYNKFKDLIIHGGTFDFLVDTIKVALMTSTYLPSIDDEFFGDISNNQVVGTGYTAGGFVLANKTLVQGADLVFDADNIDLTIASGLQIKSMVVYRDTGDPATSELICVKESFFPKTVINSSFKIEWSESGIVLLR